MNTHKTVLAMFFWVIASTICGISGLAAAEEEGVLGWLGNAAIDAKNTLVDVHEKVTGTVIDAAEAVNNFGNENLGVLFAASPLGVGTAILGSDAARFANSLSHTAIKDPETAVRQGELLIDLGKAGVKQGLQDAANSVIAPAAQAAAAGLSQAANDMLGSKEADGIAKTVQELQQDFINKAQDWGNKMTEKAKKFFWYLALISLFFAAIMPLVSGSPSVGTLLSPVIQWIVVIGIFYFVLEHGTEIFMQTQQWFTNAGDEAGGGSGLGPFELVKKGVDVFAGTLQSISDKFKTLGDGKDTSIGAVLGAACFALIQLFAAGMVAIVMTIAATQYLSCIIMAYVIAYAGAIVLGFGGHRLGHDIVIGYFRKAVSIGLQLIGFHFLCYAGAKAFEAINTAGKVTLAQIMVALLAAVVLHRLFAIVPHELGELAGRGMNAGPVVKFGDFAQMGGLALTPVTAGTSAAVGSLVADAAKANAEKGGISKMGIGGMGKALGKAALAGFTGGVTGTASRMADLSKAMMTNFDKAMDTPYSAARKVATERAKAKADQERVQESREQLRDRMNQQADTQQGGGQEKNNGGGTGDGPAPAAPASTAPGVTISGNGGIKAPQTAKRKVRRTVPRLFR